jgi:YgiT-type zinc finger domain-containing protein
VILGCEKCPICGGELIEKEVEKVLKGGANTAILKVKAEVCLHCGERSSGCER